ncbi:YihY/virulence factor BrkB family protein [Mucilaginibacter arboris]|uniref:YihY family inner membrane protein n=1 Tax=Mucilaginibacter arboris TaxID=2682090 RepID=A0A7K1SS86_9SPHI|nr:YihY/virulence factor BrkB family protein [Mucilaginibacter arboris]MVN20173.1 YihY family inner membrane protein [Mucilaginibacter arboris]
MKKYFALKYFKRTGKILIATFNGFTNDKGLKLSASLAYYTVFALAPLLMLVISLISTFLGPDAVQNNIYPQIKSYVGSSAASQIQEMIKSVSLSGKTGIAIFTSVITLIIGATSIFLEIQDSINMIWCVRAKPKKGWVKMLTNRLISFSMIISLGFLLLVSLIVNALVLALSTHITRYFPEITIQLFNLINIGITYIVIAVLFGIIFKFLPDVKIAWRDVRTGAFFTSLLFMLGKYLIGVYIQTTGTGSTYGAAGSLIVILVWIYYTSAILYFGAEFTRVYAEAYGDKIEPAEYAVHVEQKEIERDVKVLPPQHHLEE